MVRAGVFLLDGKNNPRYYTCWKCLHVKLALLIVIKFLVVVEILDTTFFIMNETYFVTTIWQALYEVFEYTVVVCMIVAVFKESSVWLIPYIGQMLLINIFCALTLFEWLFVFFFPFSGVADAFITDKSLSRRARMTIFFFYTLIAVIVFLIAYWFLQVGFKAYIYFEDRTRKRLTEQSAATAHSAAGVPPLVNSAVVAGASAPMPAPLTVDPKPTSSNFSNPNFSLSDDEEDEIFKSKKADPAIV